VYGPQETFADAAVFGVRDRGCNGRTEQPEEQDDSFVVQRQLFSPIQVWG
jgi:hypothetical protein